MKIDKGTVLSGAAILGAAVAFGYYAVTGKSQKVKTGVKESPVKVELFHGVSLLDLTKLAQSMYHGLKCTIDPRGDYLWFHYKSKRGHQLNRSQMAITPGGKLVNLFEGHYPGETWNAADEFVKQANEKFLFKP